MVCNKLSRIVAFIPFYYVHLQRGCRRRFFDCLKFAPASTAVTATYVCRYHFPTLTHGFVHSGVKRGRRGHREHSVNGGNRCCDPYNSVKLKVRAEIKLRKRSALAVNCCVIIHCLEVSCKEDQITSTQRE